MERSHKLPVAGAKAKPSKHQEADAAETTLDATIVNTQQMDSRGHKHTLEEFKSTESSRTGDLALHKKRARRTDLTFERIQPLFQLPIKDAAIQLETSVNTLKRAARDLGIPSWPCRDITGLENTVTQLQASVSSSHDEAEVRRLSLLLGNLQQHITSLKTTGKSPETTTRDLPTGDPIVEVQFR